MAEAVIKDSLRRYSTDTSLEDLSEPEADIIKKRKVEIADKETGITNTFYSSEETPETKSLPTIGRLKELPPTELSASTIKEINRKKTQGIGPETKNAFIEERNKLVNKKFKEGLDEKEERRLTFVRWQLDRIDDAESGPTLDLFEKFVETNEGFANEVGSLLTELREESGKKRRKPKK